MIRGGAKNKTSLIWAMGVGAAPPCEPALPVQHSYNRCHRVMPTYQLVYGISRYHCLSPVKTPASTCHIELNRSSTCIRIPNENV